MNETLLVPLVVAMALCLLAGLYAWLGRRFAVAHTINVVPVVLVSGVFVVAMIIQPTGQTRTCDLLLLVGLLMLVVMDEVAIVRSARWAVLFWLTWLVNACLLGGLIYLQFFFKIF